MKLQIGDNRFFSFFRFFASDAKKKRRQGDLTNHQVNQAGISIGHTHTHRQTHVKVMSTASKQEKKRNQLLKC